MIVTDCVCVCVCVSLLCADDPHLLLVLLVSPAAHQAHEEDGELFPNALRLLLQVCLYALHVGKLWGWGNEMRESWSRGVARVGQLDHQLKQTLVQLGPSSDHKKVVVTTSDSFHWYRIPKY